MPLPPFAGSVDARVLDARPVSIHGDRYADLTLDIGAPDAPEIVRLRVPQHLLQHDPEPGSHLTVSLLMGQPTAVRPR